MEGAKGVKSRIKGAFNIPEAQVVDCRLVFSIWNLVFGIWCLVMSPAGRALCCVDLVSYHALTGEAITYRPSAFLNL